MGRRGSGKVEVHAVLHRLGFRDGKDVDADGDGVGIGEAHGFDVGHAGFLAGNTPAERLRPEPADRGVIPGIHRDLNEPQRHAANPMLSWLQADATLRLHYAAATCSNATKVTIYSCRRSNSRYDRSLSVPEKACRP